MKDNLANAPGASCCVCCIQGIVLFYFKAEYEIVAIGKVLQMESGYVCVDMQLLMDGNQHFPEQWIIFTC